jgi:hypothetical protein
VRAFPAGNWTASVVSATASAGTAMEKTPLRMNGRMAMVEKRILMSFERVIGIEVSE